MHDIDVFIWYDADGQITAVGSPHPSAVSRVKPFPSAEREVLHVTMENKDRSDLKQLHKTHRIDVVKRALVPL